MSQSVLIQLADAVKDALSAASITPEIGGETPIVATRSYTPEFTLPDLAAARITVLPAAQASELITRGFHEFGYTVDIGIHRKVESDFQIDAMVLVAEQVLDTVRSTAIDIAGLRTGRPTVVVNDPVYAPEMLREHRTFVSVVRATYPAIRPTT